MVVLCIFPKILPHKSHPSDRVHWADSIQDFSSHGLCGQRLDLVRAEVCGDAPSEVRAVQATQGTRVPCDIF